MAAKAKIIVLTCIVLIGISPELLSQTKIKQVTEVPQDFCISETEMILYRMINEYRHQYDLTPIPLSRSLCFVATTHVRDLFFNHPDHGTCNVHSWSDKGPWKPFCYPGDEDKKKSVWDKPMELTRYPGKGFEIVYWENNKVITDSVISLWRSFDYFNSFLMNTGKWQGIRWNAIGIGICENYAVAWFGIQADPEGIPWVCGRKPVSLTADSAGSKPGTPVQQQKPVQTTPGTGTSTPVPKTYYIIIKSQIPAKEAEAIVLELRKKGYTSVKVLAMDGKVRISLSEDPDRVKALQKLKEARQVYPDALLYKPD